MDSDTLIVLVAAIVGSTGLIGGFVSLKRAPADTGKVIAEAAQGAVLVQQAAIKQLEKELHETRQELAHALGQLKTARQELARAVMHATSLQRQVDGLAIKVEQLENERGVGIERRVTGLEDRERNG